VKPETKLFLDLIMITAAAFIALCVLTLLITY
jgi:hypothetical protein